MLKSFPLIRQHDSMQCGIACLRMLCQHYGSKAPLSQVEKLCHVTTEGVSLLGISESAMKLGFETVSARVGLETFDKENLPCILHWNQNHFVVLYKVKNGKKFYVADPGKGLVKYNLEEFKSHWISTRSNGEEKGIAMFSSDIMSATLSRD